MMWTGARRTSVVDILQAVHLLLAYEMFIVVVSVDPRFGCSGPWNRA